MTFKKDAVPFIPGVKTTVDLRTGKKTDEPMAWNTVAPPPDHCQICAVRHPEEWPHNAQSLYYQTIFHGMIGRPATWADAMAHCDEKTKAEWTAELRKKDKWSEPPDGEMPVKHHGASE